MTEVCLNEGVQSVVTICFRIKLPQVELSTDN